MKITKAKLQQLIKEEIEKVISADDLYLAEMFDTGGAGGSSLEDKKKQCAASRKHAWVEEGGEYGWCKPIQEKEEIGNLKKESSEEGEDEGLTHGEYYAKGMGLPWGNDTAPVLDEFSVAISAIHNARVSPMDIRAFVEQVLETKKVQK